MRKWMGISVVSATMLVGGGLWVHAQQNPRVLPNPRILPPPSASTQDPPMVISGNEVGFRVDGWDGETPVGRWVVHIDGKWVEVRTSGGLRRLTAN